MTFDFTNYTFSGLIALLAAILGIGYPLFLESIRKIDEQYKSTRLSAKFQKESVFHWYRRALLISIAVSFCAPFLMLLFPITIVSIITLTVQAIVVLWVVFMMFSVFQVISMYYDPNKLVTRFGYPTTPDAPILVHRLSPDDLMCLVDLIRYSAHRNNDEVYKKCKSLVVHFVNQEESKTEKGKDYNVSNDFYRVFRQLAEYSKDSKNQFLYNDNVASQVFYNYFFNYNLGLQTYGLLWHGANIVADGGSVEWFRQQWSNAVQYYTFRYELHRRHDDRTLLMYREQHFMLGVLTLLYKRFDWLRIALFHTQVSPPKYPLTPSTFTAIIEEVRQLEKQRLLAWQLTAKYQMKGLFSEVDSDDQILNQAYRYAALLIIRLFSVNDYNITYSDPMQVPEIALDASIYELKKEIEQVERIKYHVNTWYTGDELSLVALPVLPSKEDVDSLLEQYKKKIEERMQYNIAHPELDKVQMEALKELLKEADKRFASLIPANSEEEYDDTPVKISIRDRVDNQLCTMGGYGSWSNYPDVFLSGLNEKLNAYYDGLLLRIPSVTFTINEKNVFSVLENINPTHDDVIIAMGVYLPNIDMIYNERPLLKYEGSTAFYKEIEIVPRTSYQSSIIIIRREMMPTITYLPPSDQMRNESLVELADTPTHLCSNIDQIIAEGKPSPVVQIGRNIRSHILEAAKCVRIIVRKNTDDTLEMQRLEQYFDNK